MSGKINKQTTIEGIENKKNMTNQEVLSGVLKTLSSGQQDKSKGIPAYWKDKPEWLIENQDHLFVKYLGDIITQIQMNIDIMGLDSYVKTIKDDIWENEVRELIIHHYQKVESQIDTFNDNDLKNAEAIMEKFKEEFKEYLPIINYIIPEIDDISEIDDGNDVREFEDGKEEQLEIKGFKFKIESYECPLHYGVYKNDKKIGYINVRSSTSCRIGDNQLVDIPNPTHLIKILNKQLNEEGISLKEKEKIEDLLKYYKDNRLSKMSEEEILVEKEISEIGLLEAMANCIQRHIDKVGEENIGIYKEN